jgi:cytidine deaminase
MKNHDLITKAAAIVKTKKTEGGLWADVGCALLAKNGKVYTGVCAAAGSNTFCAEQMAIGAMITDGEYKIEKIVAVYKDETGTTFVIPPCGNCRQVIRETEESNLETDVILDKDKTVKLKELLPYFDWWQRQE